MGTYTHLHCHAQVTEVAITISHKGLSFLHFLFFESLLKYNISKRAVLLFTHIVLCIGLRKCMTMCAIINEQSKIIFLFSKEIDRIYIHLKFKII